MITSILGAVLLIALLAFTTYSSYHYGKKILGITVLKSSTAKVQVTPGVWPKVKLVCKLFWEPVVFVITLAYIVFLFVMQIKKTLGL